MREQPNLLGKNLFLIAGAYEVGAGLAVFFAPEQLTLGLGLPLIHAFYKQFIGLMLIIFGGVFFWIARNPLERAMAGYSMLALKLGFIVLVAVHQMNGLDAPALWGAVAIDLLFCMALVLFLWRTRV